MERKALSTIGSEMEIARRRPLVSVGNPHQSKQIAGTNSTYCIITYRHALKNSSTAKSSLTDS